MTLSQLLQYSVLYRLKFGLHLETRVESLLQLYPDVSAPNFISWEGEQETGADTTAKLRELLSNLQVASTLAITEVSNA